MAGADRTLRCVRLRRSLKPLKFCALVNSTRAFFFCDFAVLFDGSVDCLLFDAALRRTSARTDFTPAGNCSSQPNRRILSVVSRPKVLSPHLAQTFAGILPTVYCFTNNGEAGLCKLELNEKLFRCESFHSKPRLQSPTSLALLHRLRIQQPPQLLIILDHFGIEPILQDDGLAPFGFGFARVALRPIDQIAFGLQ